MRSTFAKVLALFALLAAPALSAQIVRPVAPPAQSLLPTEASRLQEAVSIPTDPAAMLDAAAKVNGLGGPALRPWHIKAGYQTFDTKGHPQDAGTYEEFWISNKKYKRSYTSANFTQTDFATDHGLYRSGKQDWPGFPELIVSTEIDSPMPTAIDLRGVQTGASRKSVSKQKLQCVTLKSETVSLTRNGYCFEPDRLALRLAFSDSGWNDASYNDVADFQGHFLARDLRMTIAGHSHLVLHVDQIEDLTTINESDFVPPADAVQISTGKITMPEETMRMLCLRQIPPLYPDRAKASRIEGTVMMRITIGKDGHVTTAQALSGPDALQKPALDAIRYWEYRPLLVMGEPAAVETNVRIIFELGN